ncbi:MAG: hypothetical protein IPJ88_03235 [Myxococcales bacterium]|nr:MAG: hypothetical protein IPJ88_03235 [Myxococcales bacterium]
MQCLSLLLIPVLLSSMLSACSATAANDIDADQASSVFASLPSPRELCSQAALDLGSDTQQSCIDTVSPLFANIALPAVPPETLSLGPLALLVVLAVFAVFVVSYYQDNGIGFEEINYAVAAAIPQYGVLYGNLQLLAMLFGMDPWTMIQIQARAIQFTVQNAGQQIAYFINGQIDRATSEAEEWINNQPEFPSGWCGSKLCRAGLIALATAVMSTIFSGAVQQTIEGDSMDPLTSLNAERDWGVFHKGEGQIVGWLQNRPQAYQDYLQTYSDPNDNSPCKDRMAIAAAYLDSFFTLVPEHWAQGFEFLIVCSTANDDFVYFSPYEVSFRFPEIFFLPNDDSAQVSESELRMLLDNAPVTVRRRGKLSICNVGDDAINVSASANLVPSGMDAYGGYELRAEPTLKDIVTSLETYEAKFMEAPYFTPEMPLEPAIGNITEVRGQLNLSTDSGKSGIVSVHFPGKAELIATIQSYIDLLGPDWLPP